MQAYPIAGVGILILLFEVRADRVHLSFRLRKRHARLETRHAVETRMIAARLPTSFSGKLADRYPHFDPSRKLKTLRHYSDHGVALVVEHQLLIQNISLTAEAPLPKWITYENNSCSTWLVFI